MKLIADFRPEPSNSDSVDMWTHVGYFLSSWVQLKESSWSFPPYENSKPKKNKNSFKNKKKIATNQVLENQPYHNPILFAYLIGAGDGWILENYNGLF